MVTKNQELWSNDDFYTLRETRMVVQETTNAILNITILSSILTPVGTLPVWVRTQLANRLAVDGASWAAAFAPFNSGTYNNEFQIVDTKVFVPGLAPAPRSGVLTIVSQIPGNVASADMTELLADQLYWPSYNRPFFPEQFDAMGYAPWAAKYPEYFTYSNYSRARIFRREHHNVTSMDAMKRLMTLNQWQTVCKHYRMTRFVRGDCCLSRQFRIAVRVSLVVACRTRCRCTMPARPSQAAST